VCAVAVRAEVAVSVRVKHAAIVGSAARAGYGPEWRTSGRKHTHAVRGAVTKKPHECVGPGRRPSGHRRDADAAGHPNG
jgi:hypothetical protein